MRCGALRGPVAAPGAHAAVGRRGRAPWRPGRPPRPRARGGEAARPARKGKSASRLPAPGR
eukprot:scaffold451_cov365-Prasinococcus_capsulatus_cf.AAC.1